MLKTKLTHKQRIEKAHIALMRNKDWVWLAPVCLIGKVSIDADIPTAGTDGRDVIYGPDFLDKLNEAQVRATVVHENMHKALRHMRIYKYLHDKYDAQYPGIVNMAMDFVINRYIKQDEEKAKSTNTAPFLQCWDGIIQYCYDPKYDNEQEWDTVRVLEDLLKQAKNGGKGGGSGQGDGQDQHDWNGAGEISEAEAEALDKAVEQALRQGQVLSKKMAGNMPRDVDELLEPVVDWRQALRDFVTERTKGGDYATYAKPNRRYVGSGIYMPSTYTETVESILFAVDTSGSIGPEDLREVLSELQGCIEVVRPNAVDIIYWDTAVARHERYVGEDVQQIVGSTKPAGGGGTAPSCVVPFCHERNIKPTVAIWLSDGYVGNDWAEDLGVPALWIISSNGAEPSHIPSIKLPERHG
jgi:predicted metal-dependent peptidase